MINEINWSKPPLNFELGNGGLHIWRIKCALNAELIQKAGELLSKQELERWRNYYFENDRDRFLISRVVLRLLAGGYLKTPAADLVFLEGENKRPLILNKGEGNLNFSLSHSGEWILVAFSKSTIGVDVEKMETGFYYEDVLPVCFSNKEIIHIQSSKEPRSIFYIYWTRKEALAKAMGKGINDDMLFYPCLDGLHVVSEINTGTQNKMFVYSFPLAVGYWGCLATSSPPINPLFYDVTSILYGA